MHRYVHSHRLLQALLYTGSMNCTLRQIADHFVHHLTQLSPSQNNLGALPIRQINSPTKSLNTSTP